MIYASAGLRISGDFDPTSITASLGLMPTLTHRRGEIDALGKPYVNDLWLLKSDLEDSEPLEKHILWIAKQCAGKHDILRPLKENHSIDIFCGLTSFEQGGFRLSSKALSFFAELGIDLEVSLILFEDDG
jgi:hypothetical protein